MVAQHSGEQLLALTVYGGFGVVFGLWLDLLTPLTPSRAPKWAVAVRDAAAVLIAATAFFLLSLPLTAGRLRWYLFVGAGLGWQAYHATLHRLLTAIGVRIRRWAVRASAHIARLTARARAPLHRLLAPLQQKVAARRAEHRSSRPPKPPRSKKSRRERKSSKKLLKSVASLLYNNYE